ncbi:hypothetical protein [Brevibacillus sp. SAFN-007a]|uniref:hypothetical protein n=1 Tax=Brevibacillus sp. SAFN-007a TaxID=3436862 RepID=UPI003F7D936D
MRWAQIVAMSAFACMLFAIEWPRLARLPRRDKAAFVILLVVGWVLSLMDLRNLPGPTTFINAIFKPLGQYLE